MRKSSLWCALAFVLGAGACATGPGPETPAHPVQGAEGQLGRTSATGVQPPPCPGDTQAQVYTLPQSPQPRCTDVNSD